MPDNTTADRRRCPYPNCPVNQNPLCQCPHPSQARCQTRRRAAFRIDWAVPVGVGAAAASWWLVGASAGPVLRPAHAVVMFTLVTATIRLARGGRR